VDRSLKILESIRIMNTQDQSPPDRWDEGGSQAFIDFGRYFVPQREQQIQIIVDLLPEGDQPAAAIDLCCGEGLLAEAILAQRPASHVFGLDGSPQMLARAAERLALASISGPAVRPVRAGLA
jgi:trans-aconitate methyltransferase